jgi:hypothetical protein
MYADLNQYKIKRPPIENKFASLKTRDGGANEIPGFFSSFIVPKEAEW